MSMRHVSPAATVLLEALEALPDPAWCEGRCDVRSPLELALPNDTRALDAPDLATWLMTHSEPAPFGDETGTRHDPTVRDTRRLTARAATRIVHFDPSPILGEIEQALGTDCHLAAELLDVLVYVPGSRFLKHKDTPRSDEQLGTLVVELPHAHRGGALQLGDATIDWSCAEANPHAVRWVAMFGDVDHEIAPLIDGMRITAVYTLRHRTERLPPPHRDRVDTIIDAAIALYDESYGGDTLAIPCGRMIVAPRDSTTLLTHAVLRGADRLIASAFERAGMTVSVRRCLVVTRDGTTPLPDAIPEAESYRRAVLLRRMIPDDVLNNANAISWDDNPHGHERVIAPVASFVDTDEKFPSYCTWLVRAQVTMFGKAMSYSHTGYFGNEHSEHYVYQFAMMLVDVPAEWDRT